MTDPTPRTAATARDALVAKVTGDWDADPHGEYEAARSRLVADLDDLIALAAAERLSAIRKELEGWEHGEECAAWTDPDAACCAHPGCMKRSRGAVVHKSPETCCAGKPCASPADHHPFTPAAKCPDCRHALTEHAKRPNAGGCRHEALTGNNCPCWRWISDEVGAL